MNIKITVLVLGLGLYGCQPVPTEVAGLNQLEAGGCLYDGVLYAAGEEARSQRAVSTGSGVVSDDDPNGVLMKCVYVEPLQGYRWAVLPLSTL